MREVELSLNGTLREIFSFGESRAAFDRFLPSMCVMAEAQRYRPFGHRLSDELSEIILDYLHFDHHLTTTVQWHYKMLEKPVVTTNNGLFPVLAANVQNQQNSRFNASLYCPVVVLRLNTHFQLCYFIFCTTKIAVLSFVFMSCCSIFSSLLRVVFCDVELRLLSDAQLS